MYEYRKKSHSLRKMMAGVSYTGKHLPVRVFERANTEI